MKKLTLTIEPAGEDFTVLLRQPGLPDVKRTVAGQELMRFAGDLGSSWLAPDDTQVLIHVDRYTLRISRGAHHFKVEVGDKESEANTIGEAITRAQELLGHPDLALDRAYELTIEVFSGAEAFDA